MPKVAKNKPVAVEDEPVLPPAPVEEDHKEQSITDDEKEFLDWIEAVTRRLETLEANLRGHEHNDKGKAFLPPREL